MEREREREKQSAPRDSRNFRELGASNIRATRRYPAAVSAATSYRLLAPAPPQPPFCSPPPPAAAAAATAARVMRLSPSCEGDREREREKDLPSRDLSRSLSRRKRNTWNVSPPSRDTIAPNDRSLIAVIRKRFATPSSPSEFAKFAVEQRSTLVERGSSSLSPPLSLSSFSRSPFLFRGRTSANGRVLTRHHTLAIFMHLARRL